MSSVHFPDKTLVSCSGLHYTRRFSPDLSQVQQHLLHKDQLLADLDLGGQGRLCRSSASTCHLCCHESYQSSTDKSLSMHNLSLEWLDIKVNPGPFHLDAMGIECQSKECAMYVCNLVPHVFCFILFLIPMILYTCTCTHVCSRLPFRSSINTALSHH